MKIGIIPRIRIFKRKQIEYCVERKLIIFLKKVYKNPKIIILNESKKNYSLNILIISGGNDLTIFSELKENIIKSNITNFYLKKAIRKNIVIIGICYGAQFIGKYFKSVLKKTSKHVGHHKIKFEPISFNSKLKKEAITNSYHNYLIKSLGSKLIPLAKAGDGSVEAFMHSRLNIYGIMWHPERNNSTKYFDNIYFKKFK